MERESKLYEEAFMFLDMSKKELDEMIKAQEMLEQIKKGLKK